MTDTRPRAQQNLPDRWKRLTDDLDRRNPDLADLVMLVQSHTPEEAQAAGYRAALDGYLALLAADTADRNARSSERIAKSLSWATWALVAATVALVISALVGAA